MLARNWRQTVVVCLFEGTYAEAVVICLLEGTYAEAVVICLFEGTYAEAVVVCLLEGTYAEAMVGQFGFYTPQAFASSSPGLLQPWELALRDSVTLKALAKAWLRMANAFSVLLSS